MKLDESRHGSAFPAAMQPFVVHVTGELADMTGEPRWLTPAVLTLEGCPDELLVDVTKLARKELCTMERDIRHNSAARMHLLHVAFRLDISRNGVEVSDTSMRVLEGKTFEAQNIILTDAQEIAARAKWLKANPEKKAA